MKRTFPIVLMLLMQFAIATSALAQGFPYHLYETRTLSELVELNVAETPKLRDKKLPHVMISANPFYSAIRLEYGGQSRVVPKERIGLFKLWTESMRIKTDKGADPLEMIEKEFLFRECGKEYWIPVQRPAAKDMSADLKSGEKVTLYLMMVGGIDLKSNWDWMFFTNSFRVY